MIAPAMNTRPQEALSYRDLARQQAQISRQIGLAALPRLKELVDAVVAAETEAADGASDSMAPAAVFEVTLRFSLDARGFSRVEGELSGRLPLNCNGCAETLVHPLALTFACVIAETEAIADVLVEDSRGDVEALMAEDVLVANSTEVTVAQVVEDEILLNLPERLCSSEPCARAPELAYPAPADAAAEMSGIETVPDDEENPFSVLADLKLGSTLKNENEK